MKTTWRLRIDIWTQQPHLNHKHEQIEPEAIVKAPATLVDMDLPLVFSSKKGGAKSAVAETKSEPSTAIDDVLNSILPPREFVVDDVKYIQYVSKKKSTRSGVNMLQVNEIWHRNANRMPD